MIDNEVSFTSLCYITVDYEGRIWLNRLADVEDDIIEAKYPVITGFLSQSVGIMQK